MLIHFDWDDYESVTDRHTCEYHKRHPNDRSYPGCGCSSSYSLRRRKRRRASEPCPEPGCPIPQGAPPSPRDCQCPMHLCVPPGKHVHVDCPVHGKVVIRGSEITHLAGAR